MKMKVSHDKFNFWRENKVAGFFRLSRPALIKEFEKWLPTKDKAWLEYYGISECVQIFVAEGLNSVGNTDKNFAEYKNMEILLKPIRNKFLGR